MLQTCFVISLAERIDGGDVRRPKKPDKQEKTTEVGFFDVVLDQCLFE